MKKIILILLLVAVGGGVYYALSKEHAQEVNSGLTLYGNVDIRDVALGFRVAGRVDVMQVEEGDRVKKGDVLALLDRVPFQEDVNLLQAQLVEAMATLRNAEKEFERRERLVKAGAVSKGEFDEATAMRDESQARVEAARATLAQSETRLQDTQIFSPAEGTILTRVCEPGSIVAAGTIVYTLALDTPVWVRTYVDGPNLGNVRLGQMARVYTDGGREYEAQVGFISPQAEFTPKNVETTQLRTDLVYRLRVIVNTPDSGLRQGMPVTVTLEL